jgi:hypothetical protein
MHWTDYYTTSGTTWLGIDQTNGSVTATTPISTSQIDQVLKQIRADTGIDYTMHEWKKYEMKKELKIIDHSFKNGKTTIKWNDGTTTVCRANPETADAYMGFMIALAKKFMGNKNKANNLADYWCVKMPKKRHEAEAKALEQKILEKRRAEKQKKRREAYRRKLAAIRIKEEYEAKKLAAELYGVPIEN